MSIKFPLSPQAWGQERWPLFYAVTATRLPYGAALLKRPISPMSTASLLTCWEMPRCTPICFCNISSLGEDCLHWQLMIPSHRLTVHDHKTKSSRVARRFRAIPFRVKASVTRRPPHRPEREGFPHPVPLFSDRLNQRGA